MAFPGEPGIVSLKGSPGPAVEGAEKSTQDDVQGGTSHVVTGVSKLALVVVS